jgi:hypothetical protein
MSDEGDHRHNDDGGDGDSSDIERSSFSYDCPIDALGEIHVKMRTAGAIVILQVTRQLYDTKLYLNLYMS